MTTPNEVAAKQARAVDDALARLDLDAKCHLLAGQDSWSLPALEEVGLGSILMSDGPIGVRGRVWSGDEAVALPSPTAQAASWDRELMRDTGRLLGQEARRKGVHVLLAPTINLHRSPLGGRHFEAFSEDPWLTGQLAVEFIRGVQEHGVATTAKHFVANDAETDRLSVDNIVDERTLRELYLAPFAAAVSQGGAWGVMSAYNRVNGASMTENSALQDGVLRQQWGFDGFVVSDWTAARDTVGAAKGGTDVAMPGPKTVYGDDLAAAVRAGLLPERVVDALARRVLLLGARVGLLDGAPPSVSDFPSGIDGAGHAREVARRSFVLAKNAADILPLDAGQSLAVIGLPAKEPRVMGGGSAQVFPYHVKSPLDSLRAALPDTRMNYTPAIDPRTKLPPAREGFQFHVVVRDNAGTVLYRAPAADGWVNWLGELPEGLDPARIATVELDAEFLPTQAGHHQFAAAGVGHFQLLVDGVTLSDDTLGVAGDDIVQAFTDPPERRATIDLPADIPTKVKLIWRTDPDSGFPPEMITFRLGHADPLPDRDTGIAEAVAAAEAADVAVVMVSTTEAVESEGFDRADLRLPGDQDELVARVAAANPNTVVVVTAGAPVELPWTEDVAAILLTWFGGQEFADALADVLSGAAEPGGRLPTTWPASLADAPVSRVEPEDGRLEYSEGVFVGYRAWQRHDEVAPAFWFGHGLGYTDWEYRDARFDAASTAETLGTVRVDVRNIGQRTGREVVQVYVSPAAPEEDRPRRWLAGFASVEATADQSTHVDVTLSRDAIRVWDTESGDWRDRAGEYILDIGRSVGDIRISVPVQLD